MEPPIKFLENDKCYAMIPLWNIRISSCQDILVINGIEIVVNHLKDKEDSHKGGVKVYSDYYLKMELLFNKNDFKTESEFIEWADKECVRKLMGFVTKLRIYTSGDLITDDCFWILINTDHQIEPSGKKYIPESLQLCILDDLEDFKRVYAMLGDIESLADGVTLTRFNSAYNRVGNLHLGEKLIDFVVVLESLFNKSSGDLKYKIALRATHLLYPNKSEERHELFKFIGECYNLRNELVHGKKLTNKDLENIEHKSRGLQKIVERIIAKALDLFGNVKEDEIDKVLINA